MASNTSVTLGERLTKFAQAQIENGNYESVSEVVRDALRQLQERQQIKEQVREAIDEGLNSELLKDFDPDAFSERMKRQFNGA